MWPSQAPLPPSLGLCSCGALPTLAVHRPGDPARDLRDVWQGERVHLTRRSALASAGLALVTACTRGRRSGPPAAPDPDTVLTVAAVAREQALLARYDDVLSAAPALAGVLGPLRAEHAAHLVALGATDAAAASPAPTPAPSASPAAVQVLRQDLARLEREAAAGHASGAVAASRRLAPVLASLAASEASHLAVL